MITLIVKRPEIVSNEETDMKEKSLFLELIIVEFACPKQRAWKNCNKIKLKQPMSLKPSFSKHCPGFFNISLLNITLRYTLPKKEKKTLEGPINRRMII